MDIAAKILDPNDPGSASTGEPEPGERPIPMPGPPQPPVPQPPLEPDPDVPSPTHPVPARPFPPTEPFPPA